MYENLYQQILATGIGQHSETYIPIPVAPAGLRMDFEVIPAAPFEAMIVHAFSYGDILSGIFRVWSGTKGMTYHTGILTSDIIDHGIATWLYITRDAEELLKFSLQNTDVVDHFFECYLWQVNFYTVEDMNAIKKAIIKMFGIEEVISAPGVVRPTS